MNRLRAVLATGNAGKAAELSRLLGADVEARPIEVEEDAETYAGNALRKARAARAAADGGRSGWATTPGSRSQRWAASRGCTRRAGRGRPTPIATRRCSRASTVLPIAPRPSSARSRPCCPTGARSSSPSGSRETLDRGTAGRLGIRLRPALRAARRAAHGRGALARGEGRDLAPRARLARARGGTARGGCRVNAAALLLPFVVALPHGRHRRRRPERCRRPRA